jgi:GDPmannose 4,6-dehydratase
MPSKLASRSLVTGANGQDAGYLIERLLADGDEVHGACRTVEGAARVSAEYPEVVAHVADLTDSDAVDAVIRTVEPTRVFNLAGISSVAQSWREPVESADVVGLGPARVMQSLWELMERTGRPVRMVQASSAEVFGDTSEDPQSERTARRPVSPYGAAKNFADQLAATYRERGMFVGIAILFNHESPRRASSFVSSKVAASVARIAVGIEQTLTLGNIDVHRDWGYAPDYIDALIRISQQESGQDFVVATGESHTVREFVAAAFDSVGISNWSRFVRIDPGLFRPADPARLIGDASRLRELGWKPSVGFAEIARLMVNSEIERLELKPAGGRLTG